MVQIVVLLKLAGLKINIAKILNRSGDKILFWSTALLHSAQKDNARAEELIRQYKRALGITP